MLSEETVRKLKALYEDDELSWVCLGKKEYVSVKTTDSKRIFKQKGLLLVNP
jgi:hypothetical protein